MRVALAVGIALVTLLTEVHAAHADPHADAPSDTAPTTAGAVVSGGGAMIQTDIGEFIHTWLRAHGYKLIVAPLDADAQRTLDSCLVVDDQRCARGVVDAKSAAADVVYAHVEVTNKAQRTLAFTTYWFVKGHEPSAERRICEHCTEDGWHGIVDDMLVTLAKTGAVKTGHLKIASTPAGMIVQFDNEEIGITPLERDVAPGKHRIVLTHQGRAVGAKRVTVAANESAEIEIVADLGPPTQPHASRLGPGLLLAAGIACLGAGSVFLYYGSLGGPGQKYIYADSTPVGIGFLAVGIGASVGGSILLAQTGGGGDPVPAASGPVASVLPGGAYVGWAGHF